MRYQDEKAKAYHILDLTSQNNIHVHGHSFIGDLKANRMIVVSSKEQTVSELSRSHRLSAPS